MVLVKNSLIFFIVINFTFSVFADSIRIKALKDDLNDHSNSQELISNLTQFPENKTLDPQISCIESENSLANSFKVSISDPNPKQGSTVLIYLKANSPISSLTASFGKNTIQFYQVSPQLYHSWIPIDIYEKIGKINLNISFYFNQKNLVNFQYPISVKIRYKPITPKINKKKGRKGRRKKHKKSAIIILRFPKDKQNLLTHKNRLKERQYFDNLYKNLTTEQYWQDSFVYPVKGSEKSAPSFGHYRLTMEGNKMVAVAHSGIDISRSIGTDVMASNHGVVVVAGKYDIRGNAVVINHGQGLYTTYFHLSKINVKSGQVVKKGTVIGQVGDTGLATGSHLHWEFRVNGIAVDPDQWCQKNFQSESNAILIKQNSSLPKEKEPQLENSDTKKMDYIKLLNDLKPMERF